VCVCVCACTFVCACVCVRACVRVCVQTKEKPVGRNCIAFQVYCFTVRKTPDRKVRTTRCKHQNDIETSAHSVMHKEVQPRRVPCWVPVGGLGGPGS
jgi:hypothetical protein